jgi:predicted dithiol-disulfide oxidoreductase (DUF899 family)
MKVLQEDIMQTAVEQKKETAKVVSPAEWLEARKEFLVAEKEFTRMRDELSRKRRDLPWEKVEKPYVFETTTGQQMLADLFDGRSQLIVYHFMFGPGWKEGCPGCSYVVDHFDGVTTHLANRDTTLVAASRAPLTEFQAFKKRMGWNFKWVSSSPSDFNYDYQVSFRADELSSGPVTYNYRPIDFRSEEAPGASVFYKDADGNIYHTYSSFGRGLDIVLSTYNLLDLTPKGRDEAGLDRPMAWLRHHDRYEQRYKSDKPSL